MDENLFSKEFKFAENGLDSYTMFTSRKEYQQKLNTFLKKSELIDLWNEDIFYGKVDNNYDAVYVSETNLKQLPFTDETLFAVDFVVDAYVDLVNYFRQAEIQKRINLNDSKITVATPVRAWESISLKHHQHIEELYKIFITLYVLQSDRQRNILNFDNFLQAFINYLRYICGKIPFTRSAFIYSRLCSPTTSGLVIEFQSESHGNDENKYRSYIQDRNFEFYQFATKKFGFLIDKNAPWRIIANVSSPEMMQYMKKYGIQENPGNSSDLFETYYYQAYVKDIEILKKYMLHMYNSFVSSYPVAKQIKESNKTTIFEINRRQPLTEFVYSVKYNDAFWLKTYFQIRAIENSKYVKEKRNLDFQIKKMLDIYKVLDFDSALDYINNKVR